MKTVNFFNLTLKKKKIDLDAPNLFPEKIVQLAELISVILGDGHLYERNHCILICLNGIDEPEYVSYVRNLMQLLFKIDPKEKWEIF